MLRPLGRRSQDIDGVGVRVLLVNVLVKRNGFRDCGGCLGSKSNVGVIYTEWWSGDACSGDYMEAPLHVGIRSNLI
jgi:hypothetical protein